MKNPPIALFAFRRPEATLQALFRLSQCIGAQESDLTIYCDGPRTEAEAQKCEETRAVARLAQWCGSVRVVERQDNLGLFRSVVDGTKELLAEHRRVIVLEDDLLVSKGFLTYMGKALDRFQSDSRVMQVSGQQFALDRAFQKAGFLPVITTWGWGTWERAWDHFDPQPSPVVSYDWARRFDQNWSYPYTQMLMQQNRGNLDSWGICWYWSVFRRDGLVLYPPKTLVNNIGFDADATHTTGKRVPNFGWSHERSDPALPELNQISLDQAMLESWRRVVRRSPLERIGRYAKATLRELIKRPR